MFSENGNRYCWKYRDGSMYSYKKPIEGKDNALIS